MQEQKDMERNCKRLCGKLDLTTFPFFFFSYQIPWHTISLLHLGLWKTVVLLKATVRSFICYLVFVRKKEELCKLTPLGFAAVHQNLICLHNDADSLKCHRRVFFSILISPWLWCIPEKGERYIPYVDIIVRQAMQCSALRFPTEANGLAIADLHSVNEVIFFFSFSTHMGRFCFDKLNLPFSNNILPHSYPM